MPLKTVALAGLGFFFLSLGVIGIVLPLWPTTPFILLSAACFSTSPRLKSKIMKISFFREHIENYSHRNGLSLKTLLLSMGWLWGMMLFSIILTRTLKVTFFLLFVGLAVTCHLLCMARCKKENTPDEAHV